MAHPLARPKKFKNERFLKEESVHFDSLFCLVLGSVVYVCVAKVPFNILTRESRTYTDYKDSKHAVIPGAAPSGACEQEEDQQAGH